MKNITLTKNPWLLFLPFFLLYVVFILIINNDVLWGDEIRHMFYANNLLHGFYSPPAPEINFDNGPGYPLFILPFITLHLPLLVVKLSNAVLLYLSDVFLFKVLIKFVSFRKALITGLFWACYYNSLDFIALIYSEALSVFLISTLVLLLTKAFGPGIRIKKYIYLSGFITGCLALTKIIFGYVILCMLIGCVFLWIINRKAINYQKGITILLIAFATVSPYLIYTFHLTGKIFYWGTTGGDNLYWMSTPYENEYGSWSNMYRLFEVDPAISKEKGANGENGGSLNLKNRNNNLAGSDDSLRAHHRKDFEEAVKYRGAERDDAYKKIAISNIKSHPVKFLQNCFSNIGRILFNYPYSYNLQKPGTLIRLPLNGTIVVLMLFCIIPTVKNWKHIIFSIRFMLFFALFYLGGSIFGSAEIRMFTVIVPILLVWIAVVIQKTIKINLNGLSN